MAYDPELAERIRDVLEPERAHLREKAMFGGLAFLYEGNMVLTAAGRADGMMVRVDPATADEVVDDVSVTRMVMGGRTLRNWLLVAPAAIADDVALERWVDRALDFARTLPPK